MKFGNLEQNIINLFSDSLLFGTKQKRAKLRKERLFSQQLGASPKCWGQRNSQVPKANSWLFSHRYINIKPGTCIQFPTGSDIAIMVIHDLFYNRKSDS